jgi:hypothetical protein
MITARTASCTDRRMQHRDSGCSFAPVLPPHLHIIPHDVCVVEPLGGQHLEVIPVHEVGPTHPVPTAPHGASNGVVPAASTCWRGHRTMEAFVNGPDPPATPTSQLYPPPSPPRTGVDTGQASHSALLT